LLVQEYIGIDRKEKTILHLEVFPNYFETISNFQEMIDSWLDFKSDALDV